MSSVQCGGHTSQQNSGCSAHHSLLKQNTGANHGADLGRMFSVQRAVLCLVGPKHSVAVPSAQPTLVGQSMLQPAQSHLCPPTALGHVGEHHLPKPANQASPMELPLSTLRPLLLQPCTCAAPRSVLQLHGVGWDLSRTVSQVDTKMSVQPQQRSCHAPRGTA